MSYSKEEFTGNLVIYQHGLCDNHKRLEPTIENIVKLNATKNIAYKTTFIDSTILAGEEEEDNDFIDMRKFDGLTGSYENDGEKENILKKLDDLIAFCNHSDHINQNVHVRTNLGGEDSVENQSNRLIEMITYVKGKLNNNRKIVLVGHSQGGLVNLDVATKIPTYLNQIISLNTPYSKNSLAIKGMCIINLIKVIMAIPEVADFFSSGNYLDATNYSELISNISAMIASKLFDFEEALSDLASDSFYDNLKTRWDNTNNKPRLHVIASASAVDHSNVLGIRTKQLNDGLVDLSEQMDINYNTVHYLLDPSMPCFEMDGSYILDKFEKNCYNCDENCNLPQININSIINDTIWNVYQAIKSTNPSSQDDLVTIKLIQTYSAIIGEKDKSGELIQPPSDEMYMALYNAFAHPYSHQNSMKLNTFAYCIRGLTE